LFVVEFLNEVVGSHLDGFNEMYMGESQKPFGMYYLSRDSAGNMNQKTRAILMFVDFDLLPDASNKHPCLLG